MTTAKQEREFPSAFTDTITTALGTVAALTWSDAIKTLFHPGGLFSMSTSWGPWVVAIVATCIAIWGSRLLALIVDKVNKLAAKKKALAEKNTLGTLDGFNAAQPMEFIPPPAVAEKKTA